VIVSLGPFFIKLGQALSIRPDILSPKAMVELQQLCDKVRVRSVNPIVKK
jgi:aarF domain-containing kinase